MNTSDKPSPSKTLTFSAEARLGTGITTAGLGFLGLLLALAEHLRSVPHVAMGWLIVGGFLMILGGIIAASGRSKKNSHSR